MRRVVNFFELLNWRLFSGFLLLGVLSGAFLGGLRASAAPAPAAPNGQHNFLVALVDDSQVESSALQGLWLAIVQAESGAISWMPVYPEPLDAVGARFAETHDPILINPTDENVWIGLAPLRQQGVRWDDVVIVDAVGLGTIGELLGGIPGVAAQAAVEPQTALHEQVRFLRQACTNSAALAIEGSLDKVLQLTSGAIHLRTTLSQFEFIALWDQFSNLNFDLACSHPWAN